MKKFIVLEGHDAAGKTAVAEELKKDLGCVYIKTPGSEYDGIRQSIDQKASVETRFLFYVTSVSNASDKIKVIRKSENIVCDRYIWSSFIGYVAHSGKTLDEVIEMANQLIDHLEPPDHVILLHTSEEEQIRRLVSRKNGSTSDAECIVNRAFRRNINGLYDLIGEKYGWTKIDTSGRNVEDVAKEVKGICFNGGL